MANVLIYTVVEVANKQFYLYVFAILLLPIAKIYLKILRAKLYKICRLITIKHLRCTVL